METVEKYYASIIRTYTKDIDVPNEVGPESVWNRDLLRTVYSPDFKAVLNKRLNVYCNTLMKEMNDLHLNRLFLNFGEGFKYPQMTAVIGDYYNSFEAAMDKLEKEIKRRDDLYLDASAEYDHARKIVTVWDDSYNTELKNTCIAMAEGFSRSSNELLRGKTEREEKLEAVSGERAAKAMFRTDQKNALEIWKKCFETPDELTSEELTCLSFLQGDERAELTEKIEENQKKLEDLRSQRIATSKFNFTKRSRLKDEIENQEYSFRSMMKTFMARYSVKIQGTIGVLEERIRTADKEILELNSEFSDLEGQIVRLAGKIGEYDEMAAVLTSENIPQPEDVEKVAPQLLWKEVAEYRPAFETKLIRDKELAEAKEVMLIAKLHSTEACEKVATPLQKEAFEYARQKMNALSFIEAKKTVLDGLMREAYKEYDEEEPAQWYRFNLYAVLLICYLYFGELKEGDRRMPEIDGQQAVRESEYNLLMKVLGN